MPLPTAFSRSSYCQSLPKIVFTTLICFAVTLCRCHSADLHYQAKEHETTQGSEYAASNYRILVVPVAWRSRAYPMLKLSYELAARGHTVTVMMSRAYEKWTHDSLQALARARARRASHAPSVAVHEAEEEQQHGMIGMPACLSLVFHDAWDMEREGEKVVGTSPMEQFQFVMENTLDSCKRLMANDTVNRMVAEGRYDIYFGDLADFCGTTLAEFWRLPRVDFDSGDCRAGGHFTAYGQPFSPAVTPSYIAPVPSNTVLGFKDRLANLGATVLLHLLIHYKVNPRLQGFRRSLNATSYLALLPPDHPALHGPEAAAAAARGFQLLPPFESTIQRLLMVIVNVDWAFHDVRSVGPHFQFVGPMNADVPAPLPSALHSFVSEGGDRSDPRVIYVSPGSTFSFGDPGQAHLMLALLSLPGRYRIVWRARPAHRSLLSARLTALGHPGLMEVAQQPSSPPSPSARLLLLDWAPQNDLLGQPGLALFVSHCGINGVNEAVFHGVPVLCIPSVADQPINAAMVVSYGNGRALDLARLNAADGEAVVRQEVLEILGNDSYRLTSRLLSARMRSHPLPPVLRAAHWVEAAAAAARAGPPGFLVPAEALLPWWRLGLVEVWGLAAAAAGALGWGCWVGGGKRMVRGVCGLAARCRAGVKVKEACNERQKSD
ncbi:hypothetical protein Agub_g439 [Astrephomene gubernaculifera]|uniref:UDP-glycosyltransferases domain-containing protein n=1 Tax=Astrephomene gubernaculifera TaxID=47775 RepID=A0AAD3HH81_9CHLO|nr:hypothetical protein Agub_g439 [Astrephomene gubernaculifera]